MKRIYQVTVDREITIDCLLPETPTFEEAKETVIHRESIAIERFFDNAAEGTLQGDFFFSSLDNARSFALLNLQAAQERLAANMDRILDYRAP